MHQWLVLDVFRQPVGPLSDMELLPVLERMGDAYVFTEGMTGWALASEVVTVEKTVVEAAEQIVPSQARGRMRAAGDAHGQPLTRAYNRRRRADREVQELLGLAKGIIADGMVVDSEVVALQQWFDGHEDALDVWPLNVLSGRLRRILADGMVDEEERTELAGLLRQATGERPDGATAMRGATRLPLCDPAPHVEYVGRTFVFTGRFAFGTRTRCERAVLREGGAVKRTVSRGTHYLVIGALASVDWANSTHGRKIEEAVHLRAAGHPVHIVSEEHWSSTLTD